MMDRRGILKGLLAAAGAAQQAGEAIAKGALAAAETGGGVPLVNQMPFSGYQTQSALGIPQVPSHLQDAMHFLRERAYRHPDYQRMPPRPSLAAFKSASDTVKILWERQEADRELRQRHLYERALNLLETGKFTGS